MELERFESLVAGREAEWSRLGISTTYVNNHPHAATLRCEAPNALADLTVWANGLADLIWGRIDGGEPVTDHYEFTSEVGLIGCLDDLTDHLLGRS